MFFWYFIKCYFDIMSINKNIKKYINVSKSILEDYKLCWISRYASQVGREEVMKGRAKFGIFGDGKDASWVF